LKKNAQFAILSTDSQVHSTPADFPAEKTI